MRGRTCSTPFQDMDFGQIPGFFQNPEFFQNHAFFPKLTHKYTLKLLLYFISYCFFKTPFITLCYKMPLEDYLEHFEGWLKDLKKTGGYQPIVERHEYNWSNIYSDLNRLFKDEVWNHVLEQRARERDQYNDRVAKSTGDRFLHRPTERRTDHISLF